MTAIRQPGEGSGSAGRRVVVIGGGPTGVSAFVALVKQGGVGSITILDPISPGFGMAFGERCASDPVQLCNSSNGITSLDDDNPNDLLDYLIERGWAVGAEDCVPRYAIGEYCHQRYLEYRARAKETGTEIHHVPARARYVHRRLAGGYAVELEDGAEIDATDILVCTGLEVPAIPPLVAPYRDHARLIPAGYPAKPLRDLPPESRVLVLGMRMSALDAMLVLNLAGHKVVLTSPSGRISAVRDRLRIPEKSHFDVELWRKLDIDDPDLVNKVVALLRQAVESVGEGLADTDQISQPGEAVARLRADLAIAEAGRTRWTDLIYDGLNFLNDTVAYWDNDTRKRLLGAAYPLLTRYPNSFPILNAKRLLNALESGMTTISPVYLKSVAPDDSGWSVQWLDGREERFDYIVVTSGYQFPRFVLRRADTIELVPGSAETLAELTEDLRLRFSPGDTPERIWALGAATNQRLVFAHVLWVAARQAKMVASHVVGASQPAAITMSRPA